MHSVACMANGHSLCRIGECECECHDVKGEFCEACRANEHVQCTGDEKKCACCCHDEEDDDDPDYEEVG